MKAAPALLLQCILFLFCMLSGFYLPASGFELNYLPVSNQILSHRFPQHLVCESLQEMQSVTVGKSVVEILPDRTLSVHGSDSQGKPWSFLAATTSCVAVVCSDLDANGTVDLVLLMRTGANDWSPRSQIVILLFEKNGRPNPWSTSAYFELDSRGVRDLLDVDSDGRAELLYQEHSNGFWRTEFFEARNCMLKKLDLLDGQALPFFTRFTKVSNRTFSRVNSSQTNNASLKVHTIECVDWCRKPSESKIRFQDAGPDLFINNPHGAIVLDEKCGRRISLLSKPYVCRNFLREIQYRGLPVSVLEMTGNDGHSLSLELIVARAVQVPSSSIKRRGSLSLACLKDEEN